MKVWITKYALTKGILEVEGETSLTCETMFCETSRERNVGYPVYYHNREWHRSFEEARLRAEEMRTVKIKSLERRLSRLRLWAF